VMSYRGPRRVGRPAHKELADSDKPTRMAASQQWTTGSPRMVASLCQCVAALTRLHRWLEKVPCTAIEGADEHTKHLRGEDATSYGYLAMPG
jgi:hypothetical protein